MAEFFTNIILFLSIRVIKVVNGKAFAIIFLANLTAVVDVSFHKSS